MDKIVSLCKRRGFVFPSSEIYGGLGSSYDYGHYGVLLKNNVKGRWWRSMLQERDDIVALDSAIIQHPRTWLASGHLAGFTDPLVDCRTCKLRFRADHLDQSACGRKPSKHPGETPDCDLTEARDFNLMFETTVGPVKEEGSTVYLRPETAQGIFLNFKNYLQFSRKKPPFGIAQIGKSFRNEITPGNFIFRTREFEQMEMEYFVPPDEAQRWFEHWLEQRLNWYLDLGIRPDHVRLRAHDADELSHYSSGTSDVEYLFPIGWSELEGIANRGNFDLTQHAEYSGQKLEYVDTATKERYVPHVIERCSRSWSTPTTRTRSGASREQCSGCIRCWRQSRLRCYRSFARTGSPSSRTMSIERCATASRPSTTRAAQSAGVIAARTRSARRGR
jgi:glycyl-tRNA synthetase